MQIKSVIQLVEDIWEQAQRQIAVRGEAKGKGDYQNRYPLTGMLFRSKSGLNAWKVEFHFKNIRQHSIVG